MTSGVSLLSRSKRIAIGPKEKPPRENRGGRKEQILWASPFQGIAAFSVVERGCHLEAQLPSEDPGNETSHRVSLPAGGLPEIGPGGARGPLQQVDDLSRFATLASFRLLGRLSRHVAFFRWSGLFSRLTFLWGHVAPLCGDTRPFGGNWLGTGAGFCVSGLFWNLVHPVFSLRGDYRVPMDRSDARQLQVNSEANHHRLTIAGKEFLPRMERGGGRW